MEKYIEAIIEIVLDNVSCMHQEQEEHPRGPRYYDATYHLDNEQEVIKKCLKLKPEVDEVQKFMKHWLKTTPSDKEEFIEKSARAMHVELYGSLTECDFNKCPSMKKFRLCIRKILEG